jgi:hypothetical protein
VEKLRYIHRNCRGPRQAAFGLLGWKSGKARVGGIAGALGVEQFPCVRLCGERGGAGELSRVGAKDQAEETRTIGESSAAS